MILLLQVDFGIAWKWEYDNDFVNILDRVCQQYNIQSYIIHKDNLEETKDKLHSGDIRFNSFLDRASDEDEDFISFIKSIKEECCNCWFLNDSYHSVKSCDKSIMHFELANAGINVPRTVILPPFQEKPGLDLSGIEELGTPFIIKPAVTSGGGIGVVKDAKTEQDIEYERKSNPESCYLLQQHISPACLDDKRAWFRAYYVLNKVLICWWDDQTHIYNSLTEEDEKRFDLHELRTITQRIGRISRLDFFSTEIALDTSGRFIAIDYINDICDMRLKSKHYDGVPDEKVFEITGHLVNGVRKRIYPVEKIREPRHIDSSLSRLGSFFSIFSKNIAGRLIYFFKRKK
ncbi:MAG: hypothetical protein ACMUIU_14740 [bacterium]